MSRHLSLLRFHFSGGVPSGHTTLETVMHVGGAPFGHVGVFGCVLIVLPAAMPPQTEVAKVATTRMVRNI
jgi:hypothetical protein